MNLKTTTTVLLSLATATVCFGQVNNRTTVYVKPGTQVYVTGDMNNSLASSSFTLDQGALLDVGGDLNNNGTMNVQNDASILRGATSADGGSGTYNVIQLGGNAGLHLYYFQSHHLLDSQRGAEEHARRSLQEGVQRALQEDGQERPVQDGQRTNYTLFPPSAAPRELRYPRRGRFGLFALSPSAVRRCRKRRRSCPPRNVPGSQRTRRPRLRSWGSL